MASSGVYQSVYLFADYYKLQTKTQLKKFGANMFLEKDLVSLFLNDKSIHPSDKVLEFLYPNRRRRPPWVNGPMENKHLDYIRWRFEQEAVISDECRCDLLVKTKNNRLTIVVEFKISADVATILQLQRYCSSLYWKYRSRKISAIKGAIVAQYFSEDCRKISYYMGIPCVQIAPINKHTASYINMNYFVDVRKQSTWINDNFEDFN